MIVKYKLLKTLKYASILILSWIMCTSCDKLSNSLKPYSKEIKFNQNLDYNGTATLIAEITQNIEIGPDSLTLKIRNPLPIDLTEIEILYFIKNSDKFDEVMTYYTVYSIATLAAQKDTLIRILNHPELPINSENFKLVLLKTSNFNINPIAGHYNGQAGYMFDQESEPSAFAFLKGYVAADGTVNFWSKINSKNKTLSGQFIDTTALNALFRPDIEENNPLTANLIADGSNNRFTISSNTIEFILGLSPIQNAVENKIKFTLFK